MSKGRVDWVLTISGPLLLVGALFLWSWFQQASCARLEIHALSVETGEIRQSFICLSCGNHASAIE
jgi:hypothetical protein